MTLEYKCRDCGEVFNEHQAAFVSAGYDCHYIGDGRYLEEVGEDACPACLSIAFDDEDEDKVDTYHARDCSIPELTAEIERLRKENKWWKDEHALLSRDEAASSLKCRWLREENKRLREALKKIHHEVTNDIGGLPRDEALNIITWVAETADATLRQEV